MDATRLLRSIVAACAIAAPLVADASSREPPRGRDLPPDEARFIGRALPDIPLSTNRGPTSLARLSEKQPLVLTLVFTRCAGVCSPFLRSLRSADDALGARGAYQRLVLSFDPRDTVADMSSVAEHLGVSARTEWTFAVAAAADLRTLSDSIGFWFEWDEGRAQYDHPALLAAVKQGRLVRLLVGGSVTAARLSEILRELDGEFVESYPLPGRVRFRCFQYDPASGRARLDWGFLLLLFPGAAALVATAGIFVATKDARRSNPNPEPRPPTPDPLTLPSAAAAPPG